MLSRLLFIISIVLIIAIVALYYLNFLPFDMYEIAGIFLLLALTAGYSLCGIIDQRDK